MNPKTYEFPSGWSVRVEEIARALDSRNRDAYYRVTMRDSRGDMSDKHLCAKYPRAMDFCLAMCLAAKNK